MSAASRASALLCGRCSALQQRSSAFVIHPKTNVIQLLQRHGRTQFRAASNSSVNLSNLLDTSSGSIVDTDHRIQRRSDLQRTRVPADSKKKLSETSKFRYPPSKQARVSAKDTGELAIFDADKSTVILFPGQGSQFVGMGRKLLELPKVKDIYAAAGEILGFDLLRLCLEGPRDDLDRTQLCQPAVFVTSLAALEALKAINPEAIEQCVATAGFSVGEYAALVFAGTLQFEDAVKLLQLRAAAMQRASEQEPSGLLTVKLSASSRLADAFDDFRQAYAIEDPSARPTCSVAIDLFTGCKVIGGSEAALKWLERNGRRYDVRPIKRVRVSGAFHTQLMRDAARELYSAAAHVPLSAPKIPVVANATGDLYSSDPKNQRAFQKKLSSQLTNRVRWEATLAALFNQGRNYFIDRKYPHVYEVGPGSQLKTILNTFNHNVAIKTVSVPV